MIPIYKSLWQPPRPSLSLPKAARGTSAAPPRNLSLSLRQGRNRRGEGELGSRKEDRCIFFAMCGGPDNPKRIPPGFAVATGDADKPNKSTAAALLEFAAADDTESLRRAVEEDGADAREPDLWYGRAVGSRRMALEPRTPLMIAALYGSVGAARLLLALAGAEPNRACGSDGATALHCAAAGGTPGAGQVVRLLLDAGADLNSVDAAGNRPGDVIARSRNGMPRALSAIITNESSISMSEKKEYPVDLTLPDIKNGVYSTDEFRMYMFKVKPCSRAYSHDWTECPFVHPGENARRRDPRKYHYSCVPCPEFRKGTCRQGDGCEYAHGVFECWLHPAQYRTRLCKDEINCHRRVCFFAHKPEELRPLYASTGSAMPSLMSPRSMSSALDMAAAAVTPLGSPMLGMVSTSTPPMSPSASRSTMIGGGGGLAWPSQPFAPPALQLPGSRLKTALNARDMEMDMDLIDEVAGLSLQSLHPSAVGGAALGLAVATGCRSGKFGRGVGSVAPSNLDQLFDSIDSGSVPVLGPLKSSSGMSHSLGGNLPSSPAARSPSPFGLMNSRSAAFAKRSQSFIDRSGISTSPTRASTFTDWGSPTGKLDWGVQGEELQKLRKSASLRVRNTNTEATAAMEVPDVSWVQSLGKDGPQSNANQGWHGMDQLSSGGAASEMSAPWGEQAYMEQEQMVA